MNNDKLSPFEELKAMVAEERANKDRGFRYHLPVDVLCAAFAATRTGYRQKVIADAIGVTPNLISILSGCLTNGRYQRVTNEWNRLGEEAFCDKYITTDFMQKLKHAKFFPDDK